jgi:hypothetical protein
MAPAPTLELPFVDRVGLAADRAAALRREASHRSLDLVVAWSFTLPSVGQGRALVDVVKQDEYTQDVIVRYADDVYLVYDCT